jgi:hypothetical protein
VTYQVSWTGTGTGTLTGVTIPVGTVTIPSATTLPLFSITVASTSNPGTVTNPTGKCNYVIAQGSTCQVINPTGTATITNVVSNGTNWTFTTSAPHGFAVGATVNFANFAGTGSLPYSLSGLTLASASGTSFTITSALTVGTISTYGTAVSQIYTNGGLSANGSFAVASAVAGSFTIVTTNTLVNNPTGGSFQFSFFSGVSTSTPSTGFMPFWTGSAYTYLPSLYAGKNIVLNSAFDIWSRGTSVAVTANSNTWTADRWYTYALNNPVTVSQDSTATLPVWTQYDARMTTSNANTSNSTSLVMATAFDRTNVLGFAGQSVYASWYARTSSVGIRNNGTLWYSTTSDSMIGNTWLPLSFSSSTTTTPATYSSSTTAPYSLVVGTVPSTAVGLMLQISPSVTFTGVVASGTTWTFTSLITHGITSGSNVNITATITGYNGTWIVASVPSTTTFVINNTTVLATSTGIVTQGLSVPLLITNFVATITTYTFTCSNPPNSYYAAGSIVTVYGLTGTATPGNGQWTIATVTASAFTVTVSGPVITTSVQNGTAVGSVTFDITKVQLEICNGSGGAPSIYSRTSGPANISQEVISVGSSNNSVLVVNNAPTSSSGNGNPSWISPSATGQVLGYNGTNIAWTTVVGSA